MFYDVFICHASEDKDALVRPLARALATAHVEVWYDEESIALGQSLREAIDRGLSKSRHGIVVLSPAFFAKRWTQRELNGLVARQMQGEDQVILPVWHGITLAEITRHSPPLADLKAVDSSRGLEHVCAEILRVLQPQESPLVIARDELLHWGITPPVITDEWWLDVVEASNRIPASGAAIPARTAWGRWSFPLPHEHEDAHGPDRGVRLAWTAMQIRWVREAERRPITQITPPGEILDFIEEMPGLRATCTAYPELLAMYAPQLTIPGFSGPFEEAFRELSAKDVAALLLRRQPLDAEDVAYQFYSGGGILGPSTSTYDPLDYTVWLHTASCAWLPEVYRFAMLAGLHKLWSRLSVIRNDWDIFERILEVSKHADQGPPHQAREQLASLVTRSLERMNVHGQADEIAHQLIDAGYLRSALSSLRASGE